MCVKTTVGNANIDPNMGTRMFFSGSLMFAQTYLSGNLGNICLSSSVFSDGQNFTCL